MTETNPTPEVTENLTDNDAALDDAVIGVAFRWSLAVLLVIVAIGGFVWLMLSGESAAPVVKKTPLQTAAQREIGDVQLPTVPFTDITDESGITFKHTNGATGEKLLPETMGGGVAFLDYDNDGRQDLLFVNSTYWPTMKAEPRPAATMVLYRNEGVGEKGVVKYADVTKDAGLDVEFYGQGVACGDFDNDGWVDVFFTVLGPNRLFRNVNGKFKDVTETARVAGEESAWSTCCGFFDYDNDGDLDLFVGNYLTWSPEIDRQLRCTLDGKLRAYCRPDAYAGSFPYLYRNDGEGKFTDVSEPAGVRVTNPATNVPLAKSLGLAPIDVDKDGWMDLIVANDTVRNLFFHNKKDGTFEEVGIPCGLAYGDEGTARGAMGIDSGWFRNNDTLGVVIGNFTNEPTTLFCSIRDPLNFADYGNATGIGPQSRLWLKFGIFFADLDNDGRQDVLTANGHLDNDIHKVQRSQQYEQAPQLFWNRGPGGSTEFLPLNESQVGQDFNTPIVGRGAAFADIDGDGDLDVILTTAGDKPRLLRNDQALGHHWLRVKLTSAGPNRDAIGAKLLLTCEGKQGRQVLARQIMPTRSYLSQCELPATFGLGKDLKPVSLAIHWPNGKITEVKELPIDKQLTVKEGASAE